MSFLTTLALAAGLLVAVPYFAHRLQRRRAEEQLFAPARMVSPAPPSARRRSRLEDPWLFATRAAAVVALALLGATPFVRCSRLSIHRAGGASIALAIVVDDSMSMRADASGGSRFERARQGARELLASAREGDAFAVVLAGAPARIALAATTDLAAVRQTIEALSVSDRATDLDGALALARGLLSQLPQTDARVALLSDRADGHPEAPPLGASPAEGSSLPVWVALPDLARDANDCALLRADQRGALVRVSVACGPRHSAVGRDVVLEDARGNVLARQPVTTAPEAEVLLSLPASGDPPDRARLTGDDAVSSDDVAPVVAEIQRGGISVVADATEEAVATGGAPIVEQALGALKLDMDVTPIPAVPERGEDLVHQLGIVVDDPPGFTPEQRHALAGFLRDGGTVLLALGPHAAAAPLGATLLPALAHAVRWSDVPPGAGVGMPLLATLAAATPSWSDLQATRRAILAPDDAAQFEPLVAWTDGEPLVARQSVGRGELWLVTLPFSVDASELTLRPGFLVMLDAWVRVAREHASPVRTEVGASWAFPGAQAVAVTGPGGPLPVTTEGGVLHLAPPLLGRYRLVIDGKAEARVAAPAAAEADLRPRRVSAAPTGSGGVERASAIDVSGPVAIALLGLMAIELALRIAPRRGAAGVPMVALMLAVLSAGCGGPGPYGFGPSYVPLASEREAVAAASEYDPPHEPHAGERPGASMASPTGPMSRRTSGGGSGGSVVFFGVVEDRSIGSGGRALLRLRVRRLARANACERPGVDDSCRVSVTGDDYGDVWALVALAQADDVGPRAVAPRSLLRIVGTVADVASQRDGASIVHASWYRHWPPETFRQGRADAK